MDEFKQEEWDGEFKLPKERARVTWLIWGAMLSSLLIYMIIGFVFRQGQESQAPQSSEQIQMFLMIFGGLALMETMVIFVVLPRILIRPIKNLEQGAGAYFHYCIVRYALAESIAIFGLVYYFLGGQTLYFLIFIGWGVLLNLMFAPTVRDQESYGRLARQHR